MTRRGRCALLKIFMLSALSGIFGYSAALAQDGPKKGSIAFVIQGILADKGGPLMGGMSQSIGQSTTQNQFLTKSACELAGSNCTDAMRLGCERTSMSVVAGAIECWNGKGFRLYDHADKALTTSTYETIANLIPNKSGRNLVLAKALHENTFSLLDENGRILADGQALGCETFQSLNEEEVACLRGGKKFVLKFADLEAARNASVHLNDVADDIALNLCGIALEQLAHGPSDSYLYNMRNFSLNSSQTLSVYKKTSPMGASCTLPPRKETCTAIYLTSKGTECYRYGSLIYKTEMNISKAEMVKMTKKYLFENKEIVSMNDILKEAMRIPSNSLRIDRPDHLYQADMTFSESSRTRSPASGTR